MAFWLLLQTKSKSEKQGSDANTHIPISVDYRTDSMQYDAALEFCQEKDFRTDFAILVNLSSHSGNYRFFAVNLKDRIELFKGLVAHGHCQSTDNRLAQFSNELGSNCSSLGRYRIGDKYVGQYGTSYKLHGLDSSNSMAFDRYVVLHADPCIPATVQEDDICLSEGCPTINPDLFAKLEPFLDAEGQPILFWIFD